MLNRRRAPLLLAALAAFFVLAVPGSLGQSVDDQSVFCSEFVPEIEAGSYHTKWLRQNPGERAQWEAFRDAVCAGQGAAAPELASHYGRALIAAGKMALPEAAEPEPDPEPDPDPEPEPDPAQCADGLDNDGDGKIDLADPGCADASDDDESDDPAPPPPPGDVTYPDSYYAGPLGQNNILPTKDGAFLIAWVNAPRSEGTSWETHKAQILEREAAMGRIYDGLMVTDPQSVWGNNQPHWVRDHGSIPIIAGLNFGTHDNVLSGNANATIDAFADRYKALGVPMMIRLHHEFNYAHLAYTSVGQTQKFVDSWRYIVNRFKARGADNVGFWWSPAEGGDQSRADDVASYPGDEYVDWVGSDGYNWVFTNEQLYCTPYEPGWCEFEKVFHYPLGFANLRNKYDEFSDQKPFVVGETGTVYDPNFPTKKGQWYRNIVTAAKNAMPDMTGVAFFDVNAAEQGEDVRNNWLVDHPTSEPSAYQGFIDMARDPYFNTRG